MLVNHDIALINEKLESQYIYYCAAPAGFDSLLL